MSGPPVQPARLPRAHSYVHDKFLEQVSCLHTILLSMLLAGFLSLLFPFSSSYLIRHIDGFPNGNSVLGMRVGSLLSTPRLGNASFVASGLFSVVLMFWVSRSRISTLAFLVLCWPNFAST